MAIVSASSDVINPLDDHLGYQLRRASSFLMTVLARRLTEIGLTATEASVLILISSNEGITQSEIGRVLGIKRANMAPLTASIERRGFVARRAVDRKSQGLAITDAGLTAARDSERLMLENDRALFGPLLPRERKIFREFLDPLWKDSTE